MKRCELQEMIGSIIYDYLYDYKNSIFVELNLEIINELSKEVFEVLEFQEVFKEYETENEECNIDLKTSFAIIQSDYKAQNGDK